MTVLLGLGALCGRLMALSACAENMVTGCRIYRPVAGSTDRVTLLDEDPMVVTSIQSAGSDVEIVSLVDELSIPMPSRVFRSRYPT